MLEPFPMRRFLPLSNSRPKTAISTFVDASVEMLFRRVERNSPR